MIYRLQHKRSHETADFDAADYVLFVFDDAPSCSCPGDMWEGDRAEFLAIARNCPMHAEQYKNARDAK